MGFLNKLFGIPDKRILKEKLNEGAILLDVRTKEEFAADHVKGSINIPMSQITNELKKLSKEKSIIAVCASGARSAQVVKYLNSKGFQSYNGGRWRSFL